MESNIFTVREVTEYIKKLLTGDPKLSNLWVTGEISNFHHHNSGHMYLTLKDSTSSIKSIIFRSNTQNIKFKLEDGLKVNAHGYVSVYEPRGDYQFYIDKIEPAGKGALYLAFEQLKARLAEEGLFAQEKKKPIPILPKKIGIITSPTGAALRDILSVLKRRFNNLYLLIVPSLVQGEGAAEQLVQGIEFLNERDDIDLIIISRGGGSLEDLWPFNEEIVARAIFRSKIPVISGVGHETDFTISDFAADLRAPTPSAAAELAISSRLELEKGLANLYTRLYNNIKYTIESKKERLQSLSRKRIFTRPEELFASKIQHLDEYSRKLEWGMEKIYNNYREKFNVLSGKLDSLSPLRTIKRGYSITTLAGKPVTSVNEVGEGDLLTSRVNDGVITSKVLRIRKEGGFDVRD